MRVYCQKIIIISIILQLLQLLLFAGVQIVVLWSAVVMAGDILVAMLSWQRPPLPLRPAALTRVKFEGVLFHTAHHVSADDKDVELNPSNSSILAYTPVVISASQLQMF